VLAGVGAAVVSRAMFGEHAFLTVSPFTIHSPVEYPCYAVLGLLAAGVGVGFSRFFHLAEDVCDRFGAGRSG
jgi:chloride channel protein, CIC family